MFMIVGLGNPGRRYADTRHNVGCMTVDELLRRHGAAETGERMGARVARTRIAGQDVLLVTPQTFMNESGQAVGRLWRWYRLRLEDLLVIGDDIDLPFGRPDAAEARDYVLSSFRPEERAELPAVLARAADAVELVLRDGSVAAMNVVNSSSNSQQASLTPQ